MKIRALIVDDEPLARERIRSFLDAEPDIALIGECANGREAVAAIETENPDLLFLDIQMPQMSGFEVLKTVGGGKFRAVIFITAFDQHAVDAFEVHALDYLLKPFKQSRFQEAVQRARGHLLRSGARNSDPRLAALLDKLDGPPAGPARFVIKSGGRIFLVKASEIDWIESAANYAMLHVGDKGHLLRETMRSLEERLPKGGFHRISRSAIVNMDRIREIQPMAKGEHVVILQNGKQLTMTRGLRELQQAIEQQV